MERKHKIRIIVLVVALVAAAVILGISTGLFNYVFNGSNVFFDTSMYVKRQVFVYNEAEISTDETYVLLKTKSSFYGSDVSCDMYVETDFSDDVYTVKLTFSQSYSFSGGAIFSVVQPQAFVTEVSEVTTTPTPSTKVALSDGTDTATMNLTAYGFYRNYSEAVYTLAKDNIPSELLQNLKNIVITDFYLTEYTRR